METITALYDACLLYSAPLRDLLVRLAMTDIFYARWTDQIHDEWIRGLLKRRPDLEKEKCERVRSLMNQHVRDCLVTGYEPLIEELDLPDPDDRHVLAAAIRAGANVIVTFNLNDFPADRLKPYGVEAQHPDDFVSHLIGLFPNAVCAAAKRHRKSLRSPPHTVTEYLNNLTRQQLPKTVARLTPFAHVL